MYIWPDLILKYMRVLESVLGTTLFASHFATHELFWLKEEATLP